MKLAVLVRQQDPFSLRHYRENVMKELVALGVEIIPFPQSGTIPPECDLVWEPGIAGSRSPHPIFKTIQKLLVATVHGAAPFSMNWRECFPSALAALWGELQNRRALIAWRWFRSRVSAVIAVSKYGAREVTCALGLPRCKIYPIYHGVDHKTFHVGEARPFTEQPYLLIVAQCQPKKNVGRVFTAYEQLLEESRPDLVAILPGYRGKPVDIKGIRLIHEGLLPAELSKLYRGALGFVFPSLHETFGMPISEAMACGCPVITSNVTACPEVAGDAALLVDPRSVAEITQAMKRLIKDTTLRKRLREKGLARAKEFTWRKSAEKHLEVFEKTLQKRSTA